MPPFWPLHFPGVHGCLSFTTWNADGLWVENDEVRHNKLTYLQRLLHTSTMVYLQEIRFNDTDELAFRDWLQRLEGEWCCAFSRAAPRAGGVAVLWRRAWQGPWHVTHHELDAGAMQMVCFCDDHGRGQFGACNVHFSPYSATARQTQYTTLESTLHLSFESAVPKQSEQ